MRSVIRNKRGQFADGFLLVILAFVFIVVCGIFIYIGNTVSSNLHDQLEVQSTPGLNLSKIADDTVGKVSVAYQTLYWGSVIIIIGMILGIFIGSWLAGQNPLWFVPWIFMIIILIVVSVQISNTYEVIRNTAELSSTFDGFLGGNFILGNLPILITVVSFIQIVIMFISWRVKRSNQGDFVYGG